MRDADAARDTDDECAADVECSQHAPSASPSTGSGEQARVECAELAAGSAPWRSAGVAACPERRGGTDGAKLAAQAVACRAPGSAGDADREHAAEPSGSNAVHAAREDHPETEVSLSDSDAR